jgi:hypothetical protein
MMNRNSTKLIRRTATGVFFLVVSLLLITPIVRIAVADQAETSSNFLVSASGNQGQVISKIESPGVEKEYKAQMDTSQGVRIHVEFETGLTNASGDYQTKEIEFQATYIKLIEFTDPSGKFTSGSTVLQTIDLTKVTYSPVTVTQVTYNGVQGYQLSTLGTQGNFTFKVVAYAFPNAMNINATTLSPSALKIVTYITNYPYKQTNSLLSLQVETQSDRSIDTSVVNSQGEVKSSDNNLGEQALFSWNGPLTVDGKSSTVSVSATSQGDEDKVLNLVYPHGTSIVHDPMIGVFLGAVPFYLQPTFMLGAAAAVAVVAALSVAMLSRKLRR